MRTRAGVARSFQIPRPFRSMTVAENLLVALDFATVADGFASVAQRRDSGDVDSDAHGPRVQGRRARPQA